MKKLKSRARDLIPHADLQIHQQFECGEERGKLEGFELGFKDAFLVIQTRLTEEKDKLEQYPMMGERRIAIIKMQEKLNQLFEEITSDYE